jgi:hypothetical protein
LLGIIRADITASGPSCRDAVVLGYSCPDTAPEAKHPAPHQRPANLPGERTVQSVPA